MERLTRNEVLRMEPGREMDILIAEVITGQSRHECRTDPMNRSGEPQFSWGYPLGCDFAPEYTSDRMAGRTLWDWLMERNAGVCVRTSHEAGCTCEVLRPNGLIVESGESVSIEMALSRAVLLTAIYS